MIPTSCMAMSSGHGAPGASSSRYGRNARNAQGMPSDAFSPGGRPPIVPHPQEFSLSTLTAELTPGGQNTMNSPPDRTAWLKGGGALCLNPPTPPRGAPWRLVLLGAPGVGKGSQADLLCERLGACHLSTGDVFRAARRAPTGERSPAMQAAFECMHRGQLVPDATVVSLVAERRALPALRRGFCPRRLPAHGGAGGGLGNHAGAPGRGAGRCLRLSAAAGGDRLAAGRPPGLPGLQGDLPPDRASAARRGHLRLCGGPLVQREDDRPRRCTRGCRPIRRPSSPCWPCTGSAGSWWSCPPTARRRRSMSTPGRGRPALRPGLAPAITPGPAPVESLERLAPPASGRGGRPARAGRRSRGPRPGWSATRPPGRARRRRAPAPGAVDGSAAWVSIREDSAGSSRRIRTGPGGPSAEASTKTTAAARETGSASSGVSWGQAKLCIPGRPSSSIDSATRGADAVVAAQRVAVADDQEAASPRTTSRRTLPSGPISRRRSAIRPAAWVEQLRQGS